MLGNTEIFKKSRCVGDTVANIDNSKMHNSAPTFVSLCEIGLYGLWTGIVSPRNCESGKKEATV